MKKIVLSILGLFIFNISFSQAVWMEEITLNEGMEKDYIKFENMYSSAHEKVQKNGEKAGWFLFKVVPTEEGELNGHQTVQRLGVISFYLIFSVMTHSLMVTGVWVAIKKRQRHLFVKQIMER
jgi:hypothetical protein